MELWPIFVLILFTNNCAKSVDTDESLALPTSSQEIIPDSNEPEDDSYREQSDYTDEYQETKESHNKPLPRMSTDHILNMDEKDAEILLGLLLKEKQQQKKVRNSKNERKVFSVLNWRPALIKNKPQNDQYHSQHADHIYNEDLTRQDIKNDVEILNTLGLPTREKVLQFRYIPRQVKVPRIRKISRRSPQESNQNDQCALYNENLMKLWKSLMAITNNDPYPIPNLEALKSVVRIIQSHLKTPIENIDKEVDDSVETESVAVRAERKDESHVILNITSEIKTLMTSLDKSNSTVHVNGVVDIILNNIQPWILRPVNQPCREADVQNLVDFVKAAYKKFLMDTDCDMDDTDQKSKNYLEQSQSLQKQGNREKKSSDKIDQQSNRFINILNLHDKFTEGIHKNLDEISLRDKNDVPKDIEDESVVSRNKRTVLEDVLSDDIDDSHLLIKSIKEELIQNEISNGIGQNVNTNNVSAYANNSKHSSLDVVLNNVNGTDLKNNNSLLTSDVFSQSSSLLSRLLRLLREQDKEIDQKDSKIKVICKKLAFERFIEVIQALVKKYFKDRVKCLPITIINKDVESKRKVRPLQNQNGPVTEKPNCKKVDNSKQTLKGIVDFINYYQSLNDGYKYKSGKQSFKRGHNYMKSTKSPIIGPIKYDNDKSGLSITEGILSYQLPLNKLKNKLKISKDNTNINKKENHNEPFINDVNNHFSKVNFKNLHRLQKFGESSRFNPEINKPTHDLIINKKLKPEYLESNKEIKVNKKSIFDLLREMTKSQPQVHFTSNQSENNQSLVELSYLVSQPDILLYQPQLLLKIKLPYDYIKNVNDKTFWKIYQIQHAGIKSKEIINEQNIPQRPLENVKVLNLTSKIDIAQLTGNNTEIKTKNKTDEMINKKNDHSNNITNAYNQISNKTKNNTIETLKADTFINRSNDKEVEKRNSPEYKSEEFFFEIENNTNIKYGIVNTNPQTDHIFIPNSRKTVPTDTDGNILWNNYPINSPKYLNGGSTTKDNGSQEIKESGAKY